MVESRSKINWTKEIQRKGIMEFRETKFNIGLFSLVLEVWSPTLHPYCGSKKKNSSKEIATDSWNIPPRPKSPPVDVSEILS